MELVGANFSRSKPMLLSDSLATLQFPLENPTKAAHTATLDLAGLAPGTYTLTLDNKPATVSITDAKASQLIPLALSASATAELTIKKSQ